MLQRCRKRQLTILRRVCGKSLTNIVTFYIIPEEFDQYRSIVPPTPPCEGDCVATYSTRFFLARQSFTKGDTYYLTLHYDQVRLIMPPTPFEGGGDNHYTSSYCSPTWERNEIVAQEFLEDFLP